MRRHIFILFAASLAACSPPEPSDTTDSPGTDASTTGVDLSTTTGDATTEVDSSTTGPDITTTGDATTTSTSTTSTTGPVEGSCLDPAYDCSLAPAAENFCGYVSQACIDHNLGDTYCEIINTMCRRDDPPCDVCFNLANICAQVGEDCETLYAECGCVADATAQRLAPACGDPGGLFGPCIAGEGCEWPLACHSALGGQMCIPTATHYETAEGAAACADAVSDGTVNCTQTFGTWCLLTCASDSDCNNGTLCDEETSVCVYPW